MNVLDSINHWPKVGASFYELSVTNTNGEVTNTYTLVSTCDVWKWTERSALADQAGKLQIVEMHKILFDPDTMVNETGETFDITAVLTVVIDSVEYPIEGKDNVLSNDQVQVLWGRRDAA